MVFASIDRIRGSVVAIDRESGLEVDGYMIEVDGTVDRKAMSAVRRALVLNTRHEYKKFKRARSGQVLLLVLKSEKLQVKEGDTVEITGYAVIGHSDSNRRLGTPRFGSFVVVGPGDPKEK